MKTLSLPSPLPPTLLDNAILNLGLEGEKKEREKKQVG